MAQRLARRPARRGVETEHTVEEVRKGTAQRRLWRRTDVEEKEWVVGVVRTHADESSVETTQRRRTNEQPNAIVANAFSGRFYFIALDSIFT